MTRDWIEIKARGCEGKLDSAVGFLVAAGSPAVVEDNVVPLETSGGASGIKPISTGPTAACTAYLRKEDAGKLTALKKDLREINWDFSVSPYSDSDWSVKWRQGIRPVRVSWRSLSMVIKPTWVIKPAWRGAGKRPGDIVVEIDPSMAFGTGRHPTTKLCLKALLTLLGENPRKSSEKILDIGTGTGILVIAAMKLGAGSATGVDTDRSVLTIARKNVRINGVRAVISRAPVEDVKKRFSIITANIFAGELTRLAGVISGRALPGGHVVLSGILIGQAASVAAAYSGAGLRLLKKISSGEWAALVFVRDVQSP